MSDQVGADAWTWRCLVHLMKLNPDSPLGGTDWEDIANDLWEVDAELSREGAAIAWVKAASLVEHA